MQLRFERKQRPRGIKVERTRPSASRIFPKTAQAAVRGHAGRLSRATQTSSCLLYVKIKSATGGPIQPSRVKWRRSCCSCTPIFSFVYLASELQGVGRGISKLHCGGKDHQDYGCMSGVECQCNWQI